MPVLVILEPFFACSVVVIGNIAVNQLSDVDVHWSDSLLNRVELDLVDAGRYIDGTMARRWINVDTYRDDWPRQFHLMLPRSKGTVERAHRQWRWQRPGSPV